MAAPGPRVAIVHDYLTQRGGAERVVLALLDAFPGARLITSLYNPKRTFPEFAGHQVETLWTNKVPVLRRDARWALPLLGRAFSNHVIRDVDVVVCSSSGWAHTVNSDAPRVVYCYNPARWIYQPEEYLAEHGALVRASNAVLGRNLRARDIAAAQSAASYITLSSVVSERIERRYGILPRIVPPPVTLDPNEAKVAVAALSPGFLLCIGRGRGYKNVAAVCEAVQASPSERLVVVGPLPAGEWCDRISAIEDATDAQMRWLYSACDGVVAAAFEDFGLTPVEGYTFGKPALCLRRGGFLDTMLADETGVFFDEPSGHSIGLAIRRFRELSFDPARIRRHAAEFGPAAFASRMRSEVGFAVASRSAA